MARCRVGEFVVLPGDDCSLKGTQRLAHRIMEGIKSTRIEANGLVFWIAASIGIVVEAGYEDFLKASYANYRSRLEDVEQLAAFAGQFEEGDRVRVDAVGARADVEVRPGT